MDIKTEIPDEDLDVDSMKIGIKCYVNGFDETSKLGIENTRTSEIIFVKRKIA